MGTIYMNEKEVAFYEKGKVTDRKGHTLTLYDEKNGQIWQPSSMANNYFAAYHYGTIYRKNGFGETKVGTIVAERDWAGFDGRILDINGNIVARYRGEDCIGLGAAAAVVVFHLDTGSASTSADNIGCISLFFKLILGIISILFFILILAWNFLPLCSFFVGLTLINEGDLFLSLSYFIPGICSIYIFISRHSKNNPVSKAKANWCIFINNIGIIFCTTMQVISENFYVREPGLVSVAAAKPTGLAIFLQIVGIAVGVLLSTLVFIYLHKQRKTK